MTTKSTLFAFAKFAVYSIAILALLVSVPNRVAAQAPPVPSTFQDLYTELDNYLVNFNATLTANGSIQPYPVLWTGSLKAANGNIGPQLISGQSGMLLQLQALKALGAKAIMVQVGFPVLWAPFLTSQGQSYSAFAAYYQGVAAAVRQAGLKLVVEDDTLLTNDVQAGWGASAFYATLDWPSYQQARAQMALTVAQLMQPDYMVVIEEPSTEANNSGQTQVNTPTGSASMLSQILTSVSQSGVPNLKVGAGVITTQQNALSFIQQYVALPVDFIDMHIYPINNSYLPIALQIASTAAAAGKPVSMSECWLTKVRDSELNVVPMDTLRGRDPFSFWSPLDSYFIQTMQNLASYTQMIFMDPFGSEYFYVYQDYDTTQTLSPSQILDQEESLVSQANLQALYSSTGLSYYQSMVTPPDTTAPSVPTGVTGVSANPDTASISWTASTDDVGVAGYYVFRNGAQIGQTATLYYQDSGLLEATIYSYAIQAFDLAGNLSAQSAPINVQTNNQTPPTIPGNVTAKAVSCYKATFTWSASTSKTTVTEYLVYWGLSPDSITQVAIASGTGTSYSNSALSPGTTSYFAVQAEDQNHNISNMSAIVAVTTPTIPVPPTNVLATAVSTSKINVTWSPTTGGLPIAHYLVFKGTNPSSLVQVATINKTTYSDMSVTPATTYYYAIEAGDTGTPPAQSGMSSLVSATTFSGPSIPANLGATLNSCTRITLTWSPSTSGGLPIANYRVYRGTTVANMVQLAITTTASYVDTKVLPQTTYYYAVAAADTGTPPAISPLSPPIQLTTYAYPSVPANLTATPTSSSKISVTWSASVSGGLPIANYRVYKGTLPGSLTQIAITTATSYTNTSLTPGTTYYYAVQAADTGNDLSPLSGTVPATTMPLPTTPSNVTAQANSSTQIGLSWSASTGSLPISRYSVFRGTSPTSLAQIGNATKTTYTDNFLTPGTTYYYGIQAVDTALDLSAISPPVAATTLP